MKIRTLLSWIMGLFLPLCSVQASRWECNPFEYQYDMTAYVGLRIDGRVMPISNDYEIAAFVGDECRGVAVCDSSSQGDVAFLTLRIRSNMEAGELVTFRYYNESLAEEVDIHTVVEFESQSVIGLPSSPFVLDVMNKYLLVYRLDEELFAADSIAYGTPLVQKEHPSKEGYTFSGWSEIPATMPAQDVTITGSFTINRHLLTFVLDNDTLSSDSIAYSEAIVVPEVGTKEGYTFSGWSDYPELMPDSSVTVTGTFVLNEEQTDGQGLVYRLNETKDAFAVSGYTDGLISDVVVPETLYELPVNAIMDKALADATVLEAITIPGSVVSVGESAFSGCSGLLVMEWNATAPWNASCFDAPETYGNMLLFTNHADGDFGGNVVVNGVAEEITLTDGQPFRNPREFVAKSISYSREFTKKTKAGESGGWEGIVLPFDVQTIVSEEKGELAPFGVADFNTTLPMWLAGMQTGAEFSLVEKITANTPFIMEVPNSDEYEERFNIEGTVTFSAENVTVKSTSDNASSTGTGGFILQGSYEGVLATPYVYALNDEEYTATDGNTFMPGGAFVADTRDVRPFEAYVYSAQMTRLRYLSIDTRGNATGIPVLMLKDGSSLVDVYTLQGIKIRSQIPVGTLEDALPAGLYIVGGRKVVIKK